MTKPQLGTARLFLWFDLPGCPAGPPHLCPSLGVSPAGTCSTTPLSPGRLGITEARAFLGGKQRDAGGKGMGKALRASCPMAGVRGHRLVGCELGEGDMFW